MPKSGKHLVNNIDSFFRVRPSNSNIREGETVSFLEKGKLIKQEKRNGIVYEQEFTQVSPTLSTETDETGNIHEIIAGAGLTGGGFTGEVTLDVVGGTGIDANADDIAIDSTVATLTGTQTLTNKTLTAPTLTGTAQGANLTLTGDLTVGGTTTTLNAQNLQVKDKNIVLNYLDGDASSTADGAGITIQDAVNSSTDATILWDNSSPTNSPGEFDFSHSINVTGNISVSGTVDGRDLATDGSKLDGIEPSATADQTASEILTAIKTVDGATSGLDSDLLDGQHGSYYLDFGNFVIDDDEIPIAKLASDSVSYGGVSVTLGSSDATPAFDLSDATSLPIVAGTSGTLSVARGGTGATTLTSNAILTGNGTSAIQAESYLTFNGTSFEVENSSNGRGVQLNTNSEIKSLDGASWLHLQRYVDGNVAVGSNSNANLYVANKLGIGTSSPSYLLHLSGTAPELAFTDTDGSATWRTRAVTNNFHITETGAGDPFVIESGAGANAFKILNGGNVTIAQGKKFLFDGNGDTYIQSDTADNLRLVVGNRNMIEMIEDDSQDMVVIGNGSTDIDFIVEDDAGAAVLTVDSATSKTTLHSLDVTNNVGLGDVTADNVASNSFHYNDSGSLGAEAFTIGASGGVEFTSAISLANAEFSANSTDGAVLSLKTTLTNEDAVDVLGRVNFSAPVSGNPGDDSRLLAASIVAQKSATFSSTSNQTDMIFQLGVSEVATEKFRILSDGKIKIGNAYTLPAADGSANQILKTNGSGTVSFAAESTPAITALNNATANELVTVGSTTTELDAEANLTFDGDFKVAGTLSTLETVNFDQASGDTAVIISGTGNQRLEFKDSATGANAWIGIPSWDDDAVYIFGPTSSGNEQAWKYESSIHRFNTGTSEQMLINSNGSIALSGYTGQDRRIEIGSSRQANGYSYIDLIGDTTYTDFGARFIRENGGANTGTAIEHRGTGVLSLNAKDAGSVRFYTSNTERVRIDSSGNMSLGNVAPSASLHINTTNDGSLYFTRDGGSAFSIEHDTSQIYFYNRTIGEAVFLMSHSGPVVINQGGDDAVDFRVESGGDQHMLFVDASTNRVGIGTGSPDTELHVKNNTANVKIESSGSGNASYLHIKGTTNQYDLFNNAGDFQIDENGVATRFIIKDSTGHIGFNEASPTTELHLGTCPDGRAITFDQSGRFNGIGNYFSSNASDSQLWFHLSTGGTDGGENVRMKVYADGRLQLVNSDNNGMLLAKATRMGYSSSYKALIIGETSGTYTTAFGYDPSTNASASFTGDGREIIFRNGVEFTTPNSANNGFHNDIMVLKDGNVGIGVASPGSKLHVQNGATSYTWSPYAGTTAIFEGTSSNHSIVSIVGSTTGQSSIWFGDTDHQSIGRVRYEHANNQMEFWTNGIERMAINSSGNVGIGETSPEAKLHIKNASAGTFTASNSQLLIENNTTCRLTLLSPATNGCKIEFGDINDQDVGMINYDHSNNYMAFTTNATEAMRIDNSQDAHFDQDVIAFSTTPSDIRLKENFEKIENGLDVVSKLEGHTFNWKKGGERLSAGFKAQEVEKILPHLVDEKKLPLKADDDKEYKILRYEEMIPYLVEAIKEQQEQINKLEEKLNG